MSTPLLDSRRRLLCSAAAALPFATWSGAARAGRQAWLHAINCSHSTPSSRAGRAVAAG